MSRRAGLVRAFLVGTAIFLACRREPSRHDQMMASLRTMTLSLSGAPEGTTIPATAHGIWGSVTDISDDRATATVVFLAESASSLYMSTGGGILGGEFHEPVRRAGARLLASLEEGFSSLHAGEAAPLPAAGHVRFYVYARDGRLISEEVAAGVLAGGGHPLSRSYQAVNDVLAALRNAPPRAVLPER